MSERGQGLFNAEFWTRGEHVRFYATHDLRPVEAVLLDRYRAELATPVLELGCGAGRLTGHLGAVAHDVHGLDISPAMVAHCRQAYPQMTFSVGDLRDLSPFADGSFGVVFASFNVLDVFDDAARREALQEIRRVVAPDGLLIMSSHNRCYAPRLTRGVRVWIGHPRRQPLASIGRLPRRLRNRRRLRRLERDDNGYAIVNDEAHDFAVLHYYISRDAQEHQFAELGFELVECLDLDGEIVPPGAAEAHCPELHYVARPQAVTSG
jgi:SAM-dependent methyltransferase